MESELVSTTHELPVTAEAPREAKRRAAATRRWLEDVWRHGEIVDDEDALETRAPTQPSNRFAVSPREAEAPKPDVN